MPTITVSRDELIQALMTAGLARPYGYCAIRENEHLLFDAGYSRIVGSNLEVCIHAQLKTVDGSGRFLIDYKPVLSTLKSLDADIITFKSDDDWETYRLETEQDNYNFNPQGDPNEFIVMDPAGFTPHLAVTKDEMASMLSAGFGPADDTRPHINGVLFDADNNNMVATNGGTLVTMSKYGISGTALVPKIAFSLASRVMNGKGADPEARIQLDVDNAFAGFQMISKGGMNVLLFAREFEYNENVFPRYLDLIERSTMDAMLISLDKKKLISLCDRVLPLRSNAFRGSYVTFNSGLKVEHFNDHVGEYGLEVEMPTEFGSIDPPMEIAMDMAQIRAAVARIPGDTVDVRVLGDKHPIFFDDPDGSYRHLVMPLKYTPKPGEVEPEAPAMEAQEA